MRPRRPQSWCTVVGEDPVAAGTVPRTPIDYRDDPAVAQCRTVVQGGELLVYRIGGPLDVSGGEQVQECVAQDGEHDSAQRLTGRVSRSVTVSVAPSTASQSSTVARAEPFHGPSGFDQGARIALNPQGQQGRCSAAAS